LRRVITVSLSGLDKLNSDLVKLVKVIGGVGNLVELDVEKLKVLLDRLLEFALHPPVQKA
jgi:hypothetical protein